MKSGLIGTAAMQVERVTKLCYLQSPSMRDVRNGGVRGEEIGGQWRMIRSMGPVLKDKSKLVVSTFSHTLTALMFS